MASIAGVCERGVGGFVWFNVSLTAFYDKVITFTVFVFLSLKLNSFNF